MWIAASAEWRASARLLGHRRSLCLYSWVYRGTQDSPGLVLGLEPCTEHDDAGALASANGDVVCCDGMALRVEEADYDAALMYFDERELIRNIYLRRRVQVERLDDTPAAVHAGADAIAGGDSGGSVGASTANNAVRNFPAWAYIADPAGEQYCGGIGTDAAAELVASGVGTRGTALQYLQSTLEALRSVGAGEPELEYILRAARDKLGDRDTL